MSITKARRLIKAKDETFRIDEFLTLFNRRHRTVFQVVERPDPPDAIIQSTKTGLRRWVEVTSEYLSSEWARDVYSFVTPGENHVPMTGGPFLNPDRAFASRVSGTLMHKFQNKCYVPYVRMHGRGYLVVAIQNPFFDETTLRFIYEALDTLTPIAYQPFRSVFLHARANTPSGYAITRLALPAHLRG